MKFAGMSPSGRIATRFATWLAPPHKAGTILKTMNPNGYIAPSATIYHSDVRFGANVFIGDRVIIYEAVSGGGPARIGDRVCIYRDSILETGFGGRLTIGPDSAVHPRCQLNAYMGSIKIGQGVQLAPNCALYSYNHCIEPSKPVREQPLQTKGGINVGDEAWLGVGATVLDGVTIGEGAVIGAGSVVAKDIPAGAVAVGNPARVVQMRSEIGEKT